MPLNNKLIKYCFLLPLLILLPRVSSASHCDNIAENTCIEVFVKNQAEQELTDMVVYLEPIDGQILKKSVKEVVIGQSGKSFSPYISVSQVNSKVNFINKDDITHHIYSAGSDNKFSFKIRAGKTNSAIQFEHVSEVAMGCNIHDWMSGYLLVVDTPYFDKTDEYGRVSFNIEKLGGYKIVVWHPQMQTENNRMTIEKKLTKHDTLTFVLQNELKSIPIQESNDDFDFLSDY